VVAASLDTELTALEGDPRSLGDMMTTFPLVPVILDPFTQESAWILDTARRILGHFTGADCRPCWILTCSADEARTFLGPYADEFVTFADPGRTFVKNLGLQTLPAFALVRQDGEVTAKAEGWSPANWREVAEAVAAITKWSRPPIPAVGDPATYSGTPAAG